MARVSSEARNRSSPEIPRRGPASAGSADGAVGPESAVDVFDHLARCFEFVKDQGIGSPAGGQSKDRLRLRDPEYHSSLQDWFERAVSSPGHS